jgi:hypothetical protein
MILTMENVYEKAKVFAIVKNSNKMLFLGSNQV